MRLAEPTTTFTDYILGIETLLFAFLLFRAHLAEGQFSVGLWAGGFLATAIAAIAGGTFHGFVDLPEPVRTVLWKATVYAIGIASVCLFSSAAVASFQGTSRQILLAVCVAEFLVYAAWMAHHNDFKYVIYDYAPAMIGILLIQVITLRAGAPGAPWIIAGILVSFVGAGVQQSGIQLCKNFNYNDLYHVISMGAMALLYRGGSLLRDR